MRLSYLLFILMTGTSSCDNSKDTIVCQKELSELCETSVYKTVEQLANTIHISLDNFELLENSNRAINGVILNCKQKGTIKFFFDNKTVYNDGTMDKKGLALKIKNQTISSTEWIDNKGKIVTVKAITIY